MLYIAEKTKMHTQFCPEARSQNLMLKPKFTKEGSTEMDLK
jgi:hypothetical protein